MENNSNTAANPNILIVDDLPSNVFLLTTILKDNGYEVRPVTSGIMALEMAEKEKPDLILLDIMMPEIDGYEVCRRLKANEKLKEIPVIFISALSGTIDMVKAFATGGADYISKPFKSAEILARVATHIKISQQKEELDRLRELINVLKKSRKS
jgi:PleD family two-component response regulator